MIKTEIVTFFNAVCDDCTDELGSVAGSSRMRIQARFVGWHLGVRRDGKAVDLCDDCFLMWQQEQQTEREAT